MKAKAIIPLLLNNMDAEVVIELAGCVSYPVKDVYLSGGKIHIGNFLRDPVVDFDSPHAHELINGGSDGV